MTPLDHLRHWFVGLDSDLQYEIAFALVPALVDDFKAQRFRSERGFTKALEAWLFPSQFTPRAIGAAGWIGQGVGTGADHAQGLDPARTTLPADGASGVATRTAHRGGPYFPPHSN